MARKKKRSRLYLTIGASAVICALLAAAFWPRPTMVDIGEVTRGAMIVTIDEEGRTRVSDAYVVSTPIAGRLRRVEVNPGDPVERGTTIVAHMLPTNPAALDIRTREQARAAVAAAGAALRVSRADLNAAIANRDAAELELERARKLAERGVTSSAALDRAQQASRVASANVDTAEAAISMREAEVANAQAQLIGFDDQGLAAAIEFGPVARHTALCAGQRAHPADHAAERDYIARRRACHGDRQYRKRSRGGGRAFVHRRRSGRPGRPRHHR